MVKNFEHLMNLKDHGLISDQEDKSLR